MNYNLNSGYGRHLSSVLPLGFAGKILVVGGSGTAHLDLFKELFVPDPDGVVRFFSTIDAAVGSSTADAGDALLVLPGHTETVDSAGALDLDVAGLNIIGLGNGDLRPQIDFTTATTADMDVDADNITMENFVFTGGVDALAGPIDVNSDNLTLRNVEFRDVTGQVEHWLVGTGDFLTVNGIRVRGSRSDGGDCVFQLNGTEGARITNFDVVGNFDNGMIESVTAANTEMLVNSGYFENAGSEDLFITLQATDTGWIGGLGDNAIFVRLADNAANIDEIISASSNCQFVSDGIHVVNADAERTLAWTGVSASTDA